MSDEKLWLSASKIDKWLNCSWLYYCRYILNLPDTSNDGAKRGSVVHDTLECFLNPRHKKHFNKIIADKTTKNCKPVWRLINILTRKYEVYGNENLNLIDGFMMVALNNDFFGPSNTKQILGEKEFNLEIDIGGIKYRIRGFIDKTFILEGKNGLIVEVVDYKSSKAKYKDDKLIDNIQSKIYQLALKILYPNIHNRVFNFMFLKFPKDPFQKQPSFDDQTLRGFEWYLTEVQKTLENFKPENATDNLAAMNKEKSWLCGREGYKKNGDKNFICYARKPFDYYVSIGSDGKIIKSAFKKEDLKGEKIEKRSYNGCSYYFDPNTGKKRNFN